MKAKTAVQNCKLKKQANKQTNKQKKTNKQAKKQKKNIYIFKKKQLYKKKLESN